MYCENLYDQLLKFSNQRCSIRIVDARFLNITQIPNLFIQTEISFVVEMSSHLISSWNHYLTRYQLTLCLHAIIQPSHILLHLKKKCTCKVNKQHVNITWCRCSWVFMGQLLFAFAILVCGKLNMKRRTFIVLFDVDSNTYRSIFEWSVIFWEWLTNGYQI